MSAFLAGAALGSTIPMQDILTQKLGCQSRGNIVSLSNLTTTVGGVVSGIYSLEQHAQATDEKRKMFGKIKADASIWKLSTVPAAIGFAATRYGLPQLIKKIFKG